MSTDETVVKHHDVTEAVHNTDSLEKISAWVLQRKKVEERGSRKLTNQEIVATNNSKGRTVIRREVTTDKQFLHCGPWSF